MARTVGDNGLEPLKREIVEAADRINELKDNRAELNDSINAIREGLQAKGIPKPALDMALRYFSWEPEKRKGFDVAYRLVRDALGLPMETKDLVDMMQELEDTKAKAKAAAKRETEE